MKNLLSVFAVLTVISISCYYDTEESLYPEENLGNCDTTNVTYLISITSLINNNCLSCHAAKVASSKGGAVNLQGYKNVFKKKDEILHSIKQDGYYKDMPKSTSKLKDCLIRQFEIWVDSGAIQN